MNNRNTPFACALALLPAVCLAQSLPPDAGKLQERPVPPVPVRPPPASIAVPATTNAATPAGAELAEGRLEVRSFRFTGDIAGLPEAELQRLLAGDSGKVTTLKELHAVADKVERYLQNRLQLIVAKAWVPLQDVQQGVVEIRVLRGTVAHLRVDDKFVSGAAREGALLNAGATLPAGAALERQRIEEAAYRVADYLGMPARAVLVPAAKLGEYDVLFEIDQGQRVSGSASVDNTGNRYTSEWHDTLALRVANLSNHADVLDLHAQLITPEQRNLYINYALPLGRDVRVGVTAQASRYHLCCTFEPLDVHGSTRMFAIDASRAMLRSRTLNWYLNAELLQRRLSNHQGSQITSEHEVSALTVGSRADWSSAEALNVGWLNLSIGHTDVRANGNDAVTDPLNARLDGRFAKLAFGYSRTQPVDKNSDAVLKLAGQAASKNLDSSETFLLGGMGAVRAYPAGETAGDQSLTAQFEYHRRLRDRLRAFAFYDHGWIEVHRRPWPAFTGENRLQLKGAGAGIVWNPAPRFELSLIGAVKVGHNPLANPLTGNDSDGRSRRWRVWSFGTVRF